jgi:putative Holliday junction resolvase
MYVGYKDYLQGFRGQCSNLNRHYSEDVQINVICRLWRASQDACILLPAVMGRILSLDVGDKRIGVAVSDPTGMLVTPLVTIQRKNMRTDVTRLAALVAEQEAELVVVGLPMNMDGTDGEQARKARSFAKQLSFTTKIPIEFQDERLSTFSAIENLTERGVKTGHNRELVDMEAAAIILQSFLDRRNKR